MTVPHLTPVHSLFKSFVSFKCEVGSQLWLIGLNVLLPGLKAQDSAAGNCP